MPKPPKFFSKIKDKLSKISVSMSKEPLFDDETLEWLLNEDGKDSGKELLEATNEILVSKEYSRTRIIGMYAVAMKDWLLAMGEVKKLEEEKRNLEVQIKILKRD